MATLNLGASTNGIATVDQATYAGDSLWVNLLMGADTTLTVNNPTGSADTLELTQYTVVPGNNAVNTLNIGDGASVNVVTIASSYLPATYNYNVGDGSTLEFSSVALNSGLRSIMNINLDGDGTSTLIYNAPGVTAAPLAFPNLSGVTAGDQIQVVGATRGAYLPTGNLVFFNAQNQLIATFKANGLDPSLVKFNGDTMTYACYLKGTHIATPAGETKVEDLQAGDTVLTARGGFATVKWIGFRTLYKARIPAKDAIRAFPITFKKNAIADNIPHRDLTMSPGHHVSFDGKLVPAMLLVNGKTITQDFSCPMFEYFHVELEHFDILLAEGVPAESYVDTGNRSMFQNALTVALNPDFGPTEGRPEVAGIQVLRPGSTLEAIRKHLLKRAEILTHSVRVSDPDLRIEVNDQEVRTETSGQTEGVMRFVLPASTDASDLRILSRSAVVREVTAHARRDLRQVGVGVARITIEDATGRRDIDINDTQLSGFQAAQDVHGVTMRWTDGAATIPATLLNVTGPAVLELHILRTYSYWEHAQQAA